MPAGEQRDLCFTNICTLSDSNFSIYLKYLNGDKDRNQCVTWTQEMSPACRNVVNTVYWVFTWFCTFVILHLTVIDIFLPPISLTHLKSGIQCALCCAAAAALEFCKHVSDLFIELVVQIDEKDGVGKAGKCAPIEASCPPHRVPPD